MSTLLTEPTALWTVASIASLGKQIGKLEERYKANPSMLQEIRALEIQLENIVVTVEDDSTSMAILTLTKKVDLLL